MPMSQKGLAGSAPHSVRVNNSKAKKDANQKWRRQAKARKKSGVEGIVQKTLDDITAEKRREAKADRPLSLKEIKRQKLKANRKAAKARRRQAAQKTQAATLAAVNNRHSLPQPTLGDLLKEAGIE